MLGEHNDDNERKSGEGYNPEHKSVAEEHLRVEPLTTQASTKEFDLVSCRKRDGADMQQETSEYEEKLASVELDSTFTREHLNSQAPGSHSDSHVSTQKGSFLDHVKGFDSNTEQPHPPLHPERGPSPSQIEETSPQVKVNETLQENSEENAEETEEATTVVSPRQRRLLLCPLCDDTVGSLRCSGCKSIFYCGRAHQKEDWALHKKVCKKIVKLFETIETKAPGDCTQLVFTEKSNRGGDKSRKVGFGTTVLLHYSLTHINGNVLDDTCEEYRCPPLRVTIGKGRLLPGIDRAVSKMHKHQTSLLVLAPVSAYKCVPSKWQEIADAPLDAPLLASVTVKDIL